MSTSVTIILCLCVLLCWTHITTSASKLLCTHKAEQGFMMAFKQLDKRLVFFVLYFGYRYIGSLGSMRPFDSPQSTPESSS